MNIDQFTRNAGQPVRRFEYDDRSLLAVDFGPETDASVDLVDDTVIVVLADDQYEFDLPEWADDAHTFMKNGVLTVELEAEA
ncbi:DUF7127 family protein [Natrarchaeobius oligotrophus]|uniref:Hsp20/alpha crystallin family protein n=1 Tax=Natrarchaeobius chitinivorans TaxID=1679083 RepID=A0A3N6PMM1_NATCH|nr:Hsp20/alpha crystallin family protein [Natrarchaeobius chitinivorans]RQH00276.1 Hsp20/alpha crystallin family protein [Natrarchaeobius chitinivorans]